MTTTEYPPKHLPSFRPLVPGEGWHRTDFTEDMLFLGWRPLMLGEIECEEDEYFYQPTLTWFKTPTPAGAQASRNHRRTRRPLPPPPPTFTHDGKTWRSHVPGDPCPVDGNQEVCVVFASGNTYRKYALNFNWNTVIGYRLADEHPEPSEVTALKARVAELERELKQANHDLADEMRDSANLRKELASALTPRPISEAGELREGFVRLYGQIGPFPAFNCSEWQDDTHFLDIRLPQPTEREQFEAELAKHNGDHFAMWQSMKGGAA